MNRKHSFILSLTITILVASDLFLANYFSWFNPRETVFVTRVIDGDTLELEDGRTIRLVNINSPEKGKPGYKESYYFLKAYQNTTIQLQSLGIDKYKRTLGRVYSEKYINLESVRLGFSSKFLVQDSETKLFDTAEKEAILDSRGIWNKSEFSNCFTLNINKKEETVTIKNICKEINMYNWYIKDESRKIYYFHKIFIQSINLHTNYGKDNSTDIFWNLEMPVWNDDRDTAYLFDQQGKIVTFNSYGY